jgi:flagellar biogenesis protein FliO
MFSNTFVNVIFAIVIVLALIASVAWAVRRFASDRLGGHGHRGRMPRLAVIDAAPVDNRRKLVLIRRDNVEHLLMIGGPSDIVVEQNIIRAQPVAREQGPRGMDAAGRPGPEASSWQDLDAAAAEMHMHEEPGLIPEAAPRPARAPHGDDLPRRAPPAMPPVSQPAFERRPPERRPDPITEFSPEPLREQRQETRVEPRAEPRPEPRPAPMGRMFRQPPPADAPPRAARPAEPPRPAPPREQPSTSADQNLAEMAQRLEAALRRSGAEPKADAGEGRSAGVSVNPVDRVGAPSVAPDPAPPRAPAPPARSASPQAPAKSEFESLEDEMASLLGRSKNPP